MGPRGAHGGGPWGAQGHGAPWGAQGHGPQGPRAHYSLACVRTHDVVVVVVL